MPASTVVPEQEEEPLPSFTVLDTSASAPTTPTADDSRQRWWRGRRPLDPNAIPPVPDVKQVLIPSMYIDGDDFGDILQHIDGKSPDPVATGSQSLRKSPTGHDSLMIDPMDGRQSYFTTNSMGPLPMPRVLQNKASDQSLEVHPHRDEPIRKKSADSLSTRSKRGIKDTLFSKFSRSPTTPPPTPPSKDRMRPLSPVSPFRLPDDSDDSWRPSTNKTDVSMESFEWSGTLGRKAAKDQTPREPNAVERTAEMFTRISQQNRDQFIAITHKVRKASTGLPYWLHNKQHSVPPDHAKYLDMAYFTTKRATPVGVLWLPARGQPEKELPGIPFRSAQMAVVNPQEETLNRMAAMFPHEKRHILQNSLSRAKGNEVVALKMYVEERSKEQKYNLPMPVKRVAPTAAMLQEQEEEEQAKPPPPPSKDKKKKH